MSEVKVLGAGLAGCEAAYQLARQGIAVELIDMKPLNMSPAHHSPLAAELVCSNSLRSDRLNCGAGLLKAEMRLIGSLIMDAAEASKIPAGTALAVDREAFSGYIETRLAEMPLIRRTTREIHSLSELGEGYRMIATGPLTSISLLKDLQSVLGESELYFFDAAAPVVTTESIDRSRVFRASRYVENADVSEEQGDYLNCPMNEAEYNAFYEALLTAERVDIHDFEEDLLFSGCMPVESIALKGRDTLRFGPLKPVGLIDPRTGKEAYAVVQLRQDNQSGTLYNLVGFQTRLKFGEQKRVFALIPGLEKADFVRYGVMHRNSFINAPKHLELGGRTGFDTNLFVIGQFGGVEGYIESAASGLLGALFLAADHPDVTDAHWFTKLPIERVHQTMIGALSAYTSGSSIGSFQPMKANFGLLPSLSKEEIRSARQKYGLKERGKTLRRKIHAIRALSVFDEEAVAPLLESLINAEEQED